MTILRAIAVCLFISALSAAEMVRTVPVGTVRVEAMSGGTLQWIEAEDLLNHRQEPVAGLLARRDVVMRPGEAWLWCCRSPLAR